MASTKKKEGRLTDAEKPLVKAMLGRKMRNQDIQHIVSQGRVATINSARITEVKQNNEITPASEKDLDTYLRKKKAVDHRTGLNVYENERIIRAREAMLSAVHIFNSPEYNFKTETFLVLVNIAWTYLLHEIFSRKEMSIFGDNNKTLSLRAMLQRAKGILSPAVIANIDALVEIRDNVVHSILGEADRLWSDKFQACCLNFDKVFRGYFGDKIGLSKDIGFAIQFSRIGESQISQSEEYDIPKNLRALDARLDKKNKDFNLDIDYQFQVIYALKSSSKSEAHYRFYSPDSAEGKQINNVLLKSVVSDETHPFKPKTVVEIVADRASVRFTMHNHTVAWKKHKIRPAKASKSQPQQTNKKYCVYHKAHGDYTYSQEWVDLLVGELTRQKK